MPRERVRRGVYVDPSALVDRAADEEDEARSQADDELRELLIGGWRAFPKTVRALLTANGRHRVHELLEVLGAPGQVAGDNALLAGLANQLAGVEVLPPGADLQHALERRVRVRDRVPPAACAVGL